MAETDIDVSNNPAYVNYTELHQNPAYEDNNIETGETHQSRAQQGTEPTYEIIPQPMRQSAGATIAGREEGDTYDRLNREINS